jgi:hypothetical protein
MCTLPPLAAIDNVVQLILFSLVVGGLVIALVLSGLAMLFKHRREALWHQTARLALEKGQPVPAMAGSRGDEPRARGWSDVRTGLILLASGAGVWFFLAMVGNRPSPYRFLGAIPGFIGIALLVSATLSAWVSRRNSSDRA